MVRQKGSLTKRKGRKIKIKVENGRGKKSQIPANITEKLDILLWQIKVFFLFKKILK
jgi:uncharacterized protein Veg